MATAVAGLLVSGAPAAAADRARIAFQADNSIYTIKADGSARKRLTFAKPFTGPIADAEPRWSPDGTLIAFTRFLVTAPETANEGEDGRIRVIRPDGHGLRKVVPNPDAHTDDGLVGWTPRGQLLFTRYHYPDKFARLLAVDPDGRHMHVLFKGALSRDVELAPDGRHLLYVAGHYDKQFYSRPSVWIARADGSHRRRLYYDAEDPSWSPDGRRIAVASIRDRNGESCDSDYCQWHDEIYTIDARGRHARRLTHNRGNDEHPRWTADGRRIVFDSNRNLRAVDWDIDPEVYSVGADGTCLTWLTNGSADSGWPDAEPDPHASSDPGACGAANRPPLVDLDLAKAKRARGFTPYWIGTHGPGGSIPAYVTNSWDNAFGLSYNDCRFFFPSQCTETPGIDSERTCDAARTLLKQGTPSHLVLRRGAVASIPGPGSPYGVDVFAGDTTIELGVGDAHTGEALALLAPLHEHPSGNLPATAFPRSFWHKLKAADDDYERTHDYHETAQHLGISRSDAKRRVGLARRLRKLGVDGQLDCRARGPARG